MPKNIAVIGSGPSGSGFLSGLAQACSNLQDHQDLSDLAIHIFEESENFGAGLPYNESLTDIEHMMNVQNLSGSIPEVQASPSFFKWLNDGKNQKIIKDKVRGIFEERFKQRFVETFSEEFNEKKEEEYQEKFGEKFENLRSQFYLIWRGIESRYLQFNQEYGFVPRIIFGLYTQENFKKSVEILEKNKAKVIYHPNSKVNFVDENLLLKFKQNNKEESLQCFKITAATGMMEDQYLSLANDKDQRFIAQIWPIDPLKKRLDDEIKKAKESGKKEINIAIEGSALSAIDIAKTLLRDGYFYQDDNDKWKFKVEEDGVIIKVDMLSRNGYLPKVRAAYNEMRATENKNLSRLIKGASIVFDGEEPKISYPRLESDEMMEYVEKNGGQIRLWMVAFKVAQKFAQAYRMIREDDKAVLCEKFAGFIENSCCGKEEIDNEKIFAEFRKFSKQDPFEELRSNLEEVAMADGSPLEAPWQNILGGLYFNDRYKDKLPQEDLDFYEKKLRTLHNAYVTPMPLQSARDLIAMHEAGFLNCKALGENGAKKEVDQDGLIEIKDKKYDLVIDSTGRRMDVEKTESPFYKALREIISEKIKIAVDLKGLDSQNNCDIYISRQIGGIASATKMGRRTAEHMLGSLLSHPKEDIKSAKAVAVESSQGLSGMTLG